MSLTLRLSHLSAAERRAYVIADNKLALIVKDFADRGEPLPPYYPHPDELQFREGRFVTGWLGGDPYQAAVRRHFYTQQRDLWLLQCEKDRRHFGSKMPTDHLSGQIGLFINVVLPKAAQLDESRLAIRLGKQRTLRKRELQQRLTDAWTEFGFPDGRKLTTPPLDDAARARVLQRLCVRTISFQSSPSLYDLDSTVL